MILSLRFVKDKFGNQDIDAMISSCDEEVEFCSLIYPTEAKGMVMFYLFFKDFLRFIFRYEMVNSGTQQYKE